MAATMLLPEDARDTEIVCSEEVAANWPAILRECLESIEKKEG